MASPPNPTRRPLLRRLLWLALVGGGCYLVVAILFVALQRSLMYPAMRSGPLAAADYGMAGVEMSDVVTATDDGLTLHGWRIVPEGAAADRPVVLFLHGNGGHRVHRLDDVDLLTSAGAEVVLFDYRGYAENDGSPTEVGLAADARAAWDFVTLGLGVPPGRIVVFGESLGGGVATRLAAEKCEAGTPPGGLILRSTFSSMTDAASWHYPWLPIRLALLDRYDSVSRIGKVTCPILSLHGDADNVVPLSLGRRLFEAAPERSESAAAKRFVTLAGAGHNDVLDAARGAYLAGVETFLREVAGAGGGEGENHERHEMHERD